MIFAPGAISIGALTLAFPSTTGTFAAITVVPLWNVTLVAAVAGATVASSKTLSEYCCCPGDNVVKVPVPAAFATVMVAEAGGLVAKSPLGWYTAVTDRVPAAIPVVVSDATAAPFSATVPRETPVSKNSTVPVGVPPLGAVLETVAVSVTDCP